MIVDNLEVMESIVSDNKKLSWDGWDVIEMTQSDKGRLSTTGAFVNGVCGWRRGGGEKAGPTSN